MRPFSNPVRACGSTCDPAGTIVEWQGPFYGDNCGMQNSECIPASGSWFPVGVTTVINDDPGLLPAPRRRVYYRCILDTNLSIPPESGVVETARHLAGSSIGVEVRPQVRLG